MLTNDRPVPVKSLGLASACALVLAVGGCTSSGGPSPLPIGEAAYQAVPARNAQTDLNERVNPGDRLSIRIFGEPELSSENYRVDSVGYLRMPLVGEIIAIGMTPSELGEEITRRLGTRYVRDPQVAVAILERPRATFAVEGDVEQPGVFEATPNTTLLTALAQARSPTNTAKLSEIVVLRQINGRQAGGRFDLVAIRRGRAPDPQILPGDKIVVGNSALKSTWRDFLAATPLFNIFYIL